MPQGPNISFLFQSLTPSCCATCTLCLCQSPHLSYKKARPANGHKVKGVMSLRGNEEQRRLWEKSKGTYTSASHLSYYGGTVLSPSLAVHLFIFTISTLRQTVFEVLNCRDEQGRILLLGSPTTWQERQTCKHPTGQGKHAKDRSSTYINTAARGSTLDVCVDSSVRKASGRGHTSAAS